MTFSSPARFECCHCGKHADIPLSFSVFGKNEARLDVCDSGLSEELSRNGLVAVTIDLYTSRLGCGPFILCNECLGAYNRLFEENLEAEKKFIGLRGSREG